MCDRLPAGRPVGRIVADAALQHSWERLEDEYAAQLEIESTGWPEERAAESAL